MAVNREWQLGRRPKGWPTQDDFRLADVDVPAPRPGHVLGRDLGMSVDPYMRGRMNDAESYAAPYQLDQPMYGGAVGRIEQSRVDALAEGAVVRHGLGWRDWAVVPAKQAEVVAPDADGVPPSAYLGMLGMRGLTAW